MLLMDEPMAALDALTRESIQELLLKVWEHTHKMFFFITHSVEEALFLGSRLIVMSPRPGRITHTYELDFNRRFLKEGNARAIKSSPDFIEMRETVLSIIYGDERAAAETREVVHA
jgi:taurine transport system ATP-binding protein